MIEGYISNSQQNNQTSKMTQSVGGGRANKKTGSPALTTIVTDVCVCDEGEGERLTGVGERRSDMRTTRL